MGAKIKFINYSAKVTKEIEFGVQNFLEEAGGLIESRVKDNTRTATSQTRKSWQHIVEKNKVTIGSPLENALWEELGTGEHALYGKGRKGGWYIPADSLDSKTKSLFDTKYHFKKKYGKNKKVYYYTEGKKGTKALEKAFKDSKKAIEIHAETIFGELNKK